MSWSSLSGRSGSGKSTLLRAACGLVPHFHGGDVAGAAGSGGLDLRDHGPAELGATVGIVAQEPETQVVSATVRAEVELPLEIRGEGRPRPGARRRGGRAGARDRAPARPPDGRPLGRRAPARGAGRRPGRAPAPDPARRADLAARPGRGRRADRRPAAPERGVGGHRADRRAPARALPARRPTASSRSPRAGSRFDGEPGAFLESTLDADPALATPGREPVRRPRDPPGARRRQGRPAGGWPSSPSARHHRRARRPRSRPAGRRAVRRRPRAAPALEARDLWVELDSGAERRRVLRGLTPSDRAAASASS